MSHGLDHSGDRTWDGHQGSDGDRFRDRRRSFEQWYATTYPLWLGYPYPYDLDPGWFDWGDSGDSTDDQGAAASNYPAANPYGSDGAPEQPYPGENWPAYPPIEQPAPAPSVSSASLPEQPLTVIFKDGRTPEKMQNYMMTANVLTDLDPHRYEEIPLNQINVAATVQVNKAAGLEFQVPGALRN